MPRLDDDRLRQLAASYHTPLYVFDEQTIRDKCRALKAAITYKDTTIRYACKALTLQAILAIMREEGMWIDASSVNEVHRALRAGFAPEEIYYTGEGSTPSVYRFLVDSGVPINCTSLDQLRLLGAIAPGQACSIRVNPGRGHGENDRTNTGGPGSKHGIYHDRIEEARAIAGSFGLRIVGIHSHIGSGSRPEDWRVWNAINQTVLAIARGFGPDLEFVNLGGGLPVPYRPGEAPMDIVAWGRALSRSMADFSADLGRPVRLFVEPGRFLVAESGVLLAEIQSLKSTSAEGGARGYDYAIVNTGLNHNIRPAMYGSYHDIRFVPRDGAQRGAGKDYVVAGYLCESGDVFTTDECGRLAPRPFPELRVGDLMVMANTGAYSHAMKNEYNSMNLPASVLVDPSGQARIIERRGTLDDIMRRELEVYNPARAIAT
ncbi:MAG: diaminopimelate decarboxylase [Alphaproteobacteria bacterium]|nr:diaminopimelate decarboxylase [Alphaproteobacteria bacterium]